jgi:hypothetical protein
MPEVNSNGQQLLGRFSGGTFKEQLTAAAVSLTHGKCSLRGCPYPAVQGAIVCGYHQQFFSYECNLFDRSIEDHYRNLEDKFTADGLVIQYRRRGRQTTEERLVGLYHSILGSAGMLTDALKHLGEAPPSQIIDWSRNHFAAQELLELSRYPAKQIVCPYCGWLEIRRQQEGLNLRYRCRLCSGSWTLTARTILYHRRLTLDKWVHALCVLRDKDSYGVIAELRDKLEISLTAAGALNHKLRLCGETLGLTIGWPGNQSSQIRNELRQKLGLTSATQPPTPAPKLMSTGEVAAHLICSARRVGYWAITGRLKFTRFHGNRFFSREDVLAFKVPQAGATGRLVSSAPSRRRIKELFNKGFTQTELKAEIGRLYFPELMRASKEAKVKAAYDRLIQLPKTPRMVPAAPTRNMIQQLGRRGFTKWEIARALGANLKIGKQFTHSSTEVKVKKAYERLMRSSPSQFAPAARTWQMIRELLEHGFTETRLARELGVGTRIKFGRDRVHSSTERKVERFYKRSMARHSQPGRGPGKGER